jgi:hypothetical protein
MERSRIYTSGMGILLSFSFDLATLPAGTVSSQVSHATLIVFVNRVNVAGSVSVAPVTASWGEYSVTSAAAQAAGSSIGNFPVSVAGQFVSVDVTNQVQAWLNTPASNNGFALTSAAADVLFDSKENDETGHAPRLDIALVNQGPPGIQGVQGIPGVPGIAGLQTDRARWTHWSARDSGHPRPHRASGSCRGNGASRPSSQLPGRMV